MYDREYERLLWLHSVIWLSNNKSRRSTTGRNRDRHYMAKPSTYMEHIIRDGDYHRKAIMTTGPWGIPLVCTREEDGTWESQYRDHLSALTLRNRIGEWLSFATEEEIKDFSTASSAIGLYVQEDNYNVLPSYKTYINCFTKPGSVEYIRKEFTLDIQLKVPTFQHSE
jgi:hypothetical protein